ncbi:hypothetical protein T492DRAFT_996322 [Pavlovales sp. CCMP2436]|nr:hypothetical protein T492DRAFT_996322 [Pavlovales sp. CCMP2436]
MAPCQGRSCLIAAALLALAVAAQRVDTGDGTCNETSCEACVSSSKDGIAYGRGCQWCADGPRIEHRCYNYLATGGPEFCTSYALLNQCSRFESPREHKLVPPWVPVLISGAAVAAVVGLAVLVAMIYMRGRAPEGRALSGWTGADEWQLGDQVLTLQPSTHADTVPSTSTHSDGICVICLVARAESAFYPCGHRACCDKCAERVRIEPQPRCPLCRQPARDAVHVFD